MDYFETLTHTMQMLSQNEKTLFIGQSVRWSGHALQKTLIDVSESQKIELPVMEDFQFGMSIGLALEGWIPINIYPRFDFLIIATNQILNHLANIREVSDGLYAPRVITRTCIGSTDPLDPGPQHRQDYSEALKLMVRGEIDVINLDTKEKIFPSYENALYRKDNKPTILIEYGDYYHKL